MSADDHDLWSICLFRAANLAESLKAVLVRKPDVEQYHIVVGIAYEFQRFGGCGAGGYKVTFFAQDAFERLSYLCLIVDDQYVVHAVILPVASSAVASGSISDAVLSSMMNFAP